MLTVNGTSVEDMSYR